MPRRHPIPSRLPLVAIASLLASAFSCGAHAAEPAAAVAAKLQSMQAAQLAALTKAAPVAPVAAPAANPAAGVPAAGVAPSLRAPVSVASSAPAAAAPAAPAASDGTPEDLLATSRHFLDDAVAQAPAALGGGTAPLRMEVSVGALDSRLRLAPCARIEPYLPPGMRLWGRTRLGLRCVDGPVRWNVFLPVTVKAFGPAWVVPGPVSPGATLAAGDAVQAEVDWAEDASPVIADPAQWIGTTVIRSLNAGQALRQAAVRPPQAFQAGAQIRVVAAGAGFAVASDGQAITAGFVGQPVRVRMDGGRIMSGTVRDARTVEVVF